MAPTTVLVDGCSALVERVANGIDSSAARVTWFRAFGRAVWRFHALAFGILYFRALTFGIPCRFATSDGLIVANKAGLVVDDESLAVVAVRTELNRTGELCVPLIGAGRRIPNSKRSRQNDDRHTCASDRPWYSVHRCPDFPVSAAAGPVQ